MREIIKKTRGLVISIYPIVLSVAIMMTGFVVLILSGCLNMDAKSNIKAKSNVEAKAEINTAVKGIDFSENNKKEAILDIKNSGSVIENQKLSSDEKIEVTGADLSDNSKKEANMTLKNSGSDIKNQNQTSNIGAFSGGAPYLLFLMIAMLTIYYKIQIVKIENKRQEDKEEHELVTTILKDYLKRSGKTEAQIKRKIEQEKPKNN